MGIDFLQRIILSCQLQKPTWVKNLKDQYPVVKMAIFTEAKGLWYTQQCRLFHFRIAKLAKIHWLLPAVSACVIMAKCLMACCVYLLVGDRFCQRNKVTTVQNADTKLCRCVGWHQNEGGWRNFHFTPLALIHGPRNTYRVQVPKKSAKIWSHFLNKLCGNHFMTQ